MRSTTVRRGFPGGLRRAALLLGLTVVALGGCAVYEPAPTPYYYGGPTYAYPAYPAPTYSPCCTGFFDFSYRSGGGHRDWDHGHDWGHGHGWGRHDWH